MKKQCFATNSVSHKKSLSVRVAWLLCSVPMVCGTGAVMAAPDSATRPATDKEASTDDAAAKKKPELPIPKEESSVTHHDVKIGDQPITYTATAGNLLIRKGDDPVASMFYVAYTREGVKDTWIGVR